MLAEKARHVVEPSVDRITERAQVCVTRKRGPPAVRVSAQLDQAVDNFDQSVSYRLDEQVVIVGCVGRRICEHA